MVIKNLYGTELANIQEIQSEATKKIAVDFQASQMESSQSQKKAAISPANVPHSVLSYVDRNGELIGTSHTFVALARKLQLKAAVGCATLC